jgi:hypothetical protein
MKHKIYKEFVHFYKFIFIENDFFLGGLIEEILINFHNKFQKQSFKKSFIWKNYFEKKDM